MKKLGRPPLPADERKGRLVSARFNDAEHEAMRRAAADAGLSLSDWVRWVLRLAAKRVPIRYDELNDRRRPHREAAPAVLKADTLSALRKRYGLE